MIDETKQEMAIDYVLGELSPMAAESFERELAGNEELRSFTKELREGFASMASTTESLRPRSELFQRILTEVNSPKKSKLVWASFVPWALAACLAAALLILGFDDLRKKNEVAVLLQRDALAHLQISALQAQVQAYSNVSAVVVWNQQHQRGLLRLEALPGLQSGHDYQLWIIDPAEKTPVSAGIVPIESGNSARFEFRPEHPVTSAAKFAVSIEKTGGSTVPQGQIILIGQ